MLIDPRVEMAARVANQFKLDPLKILNSDKWDTIIRTAAFNVIQRDVQQANEKRARQAKAKQS